MTLKVVDADLAAAGCAVDRCGQDLAAAHTAADARIEAARCGWPGRSAHVLADLAERWAAGSADMLARMGEHAGALQASARGFAEHERGGAAVLGGFGGER